MFSEIQIKKWVPEGFPSSTLSEFSFVYILKHEDANESISQWEKYLFIVPQCSQVLTEEFQCYL